MKNNKIGIIEKILKKICVGFKYGKLSDEIVNIRKNINSLSEINGIEEKIYIYRIQLKKYYEDKDIKGIKLFLKEKCFMKI